MIKSYPVLSKEERAAIRKAGYDLTYLIEKNEDVFYPFISHSGFLRNFSSRQKPAILKYRATLHMRRLKGPPRYYKGPRQPHAISFVSYEDFLNKLTSYMMGHKMKGVWDYGLYSAPNDL